jgi:hypothetical protein
MVVCDVTIDVDVDVGFEVAPAELLGLVLISPILTQ